MTGAWQPIETAPMDGTWIVVWCAGETKGFELNVMCWDGRRGCWRVNWYGEIVDGLPPTHWMLPEPPK